MTSSSSAWNSVIGELQQHHWIPLSVHSARSPKLRSAYSTPKTGAWAAYLPEQTALPVGSSTLSITTYPTIPHVCSTAPASLRSLQWSDRYGVLLLKHLTEEPLTFLYWYMSTLIGLKYWVIENVSLFNYWVIQNGTHHWLLLVILPNEELWIPLAVFAFSGNRVN